MPLSWRSSSKSRLEHVSRNFFSKGLGRSILFRLLQGGPGSVRLRFGIERFERFRFSVPAVPLWKEFLCVSVQFHREEGSGFGSWKTIPAVPVPRSVPAKTVPTVPVSGSGSVPGPAPAANNSRMGPWLDLHSRRAELLSQSSTPRGSCDNTLLRRVLRRFSRLLSRRF